jgi:AI-2 transport protein TqsA
MNITRIAAWAVLLSLLLAFLVLAKDFLIPLVAAACIVFIINSIATLLGKVSFGSFRLPKWVNLIVATVGIVVGIVFSIEIIVQSVNGMMEAAPSYEANLRRMVISAMVALNIQELPTVSQMIESIDIGAIASAAGSMLSSFAGSLFLVVLYVIFMLLEQDTFPKKWRAMFGSQTAIEDSRRTLGQIGKSVREYITYKTAINVVNALIIFLIIWGIGLDFPVFWAFLIFLINYIPTIGTLASVGLPTLFALLQFTTWAPIIGVAVGITTVQTVMMNFVEPRILGRLLNISGLVVLLALVLWGTLWGLVGMVLSVPIMVSLIIIFARFPSTRPVAIWLSADGNPVDNG